MEHVLAEQPNYQWGWQQLVEWANEARLFDKARDAARNLVRLTPDSASALALAGETEQRAGDDKAAADYYERSLKAYPGEGWVMDALGRIHWATPDLSALARVSELGHTGSALWVARAYRVLQLARQKEWESASFALATAAQCPFGLGSLSRFFAQELKTLGMTERALHTLRKGSADGTLGVSWATLLVYLETEGKNWLVWQHFTPWISRFGEAATEPIAVFLDAVGDAALAATALPELMATQRDYLQTQTVLYGKVGYALVNSARYVEALDWLKDSARRPDAEGWMVANTALAHWEQGHYLPAAAVSSVVLERELRDNTWNWHVGMACFGHALSGDVVDAQAAREKLAPASDDEPLLYRWALELGVAITAVRSAKQKHAKRVFAQERARLRAACTKLALNNASYRSLHRTALQCMAKHCNYFLWPWDYRLSLARG
jgi:cellulose synthase operon protein C